MPFYSSFCGAFSDIIHPQVFSRLYNIHCLFIREVLKIKYFFTPETQLPSGLGFEHYGLAHIAALFLCAGFTAALCIIYSRCEKRKRLRLFLGLTLMLCELLRLVNLAVHGGLDVYQLPLHLCGLAVFFTLWHSIRPNELIGSFLYFCCMPGAACALLFPDWTFCPIWSFHSLLAFFIHSLLIAYPLALVLSADISPKAALLPRCALLLLFLALPVYLFDRIFNANYMFLLSPAPDSPLSWFASFLGKPGYLLGYIPMIAAVWLVLCLPLRK